MEATDVDIIGDGQIALTGFGTDGAVLIYNNSTAPEVSVLRLANNVAAMNQYVGTGDPEGVVSATLGSMYYRTDSSGSSSTQVYVKVFNGGGTTGWVALADVSSLTSTTTAVSLQTAYDGGNAILTSSTSTPVYISVPTPGAFSSVPGLAITTDLNTSRGIVFGRSNFANDISSFGMTDDVLNPAGASGTFAYYNHDLNSFGFSLLGNGGSTKSNFALNNTEISSLAAMNISNSANANQQALLRLSNDTDVASIIQYVGVGSPESVIVAESGSIYFQTDAVGATNQLFVKQPVMVIIVIGMRSLHLPPLRAMLEAPILAGRLRRGSYDHSS
ncbi:hypothetical protein IPH19_01695 [Candidatus Uhrbacteria bacterium]|nr:MAG: hypothetical protein IPH19_01695 [Candidatus Uhrbacteria bacterium]